MKLRFRIIIGLLLIIAIVLIGSGPYFHNRGIEIQRGSATNSVMAASTQQSSQPDEAISGKPVRIEIPSSQIDLAVIDGIYNSQSQTWTLADDKAQFATITQLANNQQGNTFIYGHNNKKVFARLGGIKPEQIAVVYTDNGHRFVYKFISAYETTPEDSRLFNYQGAPILTLQTCSGLWNQHRKLFTFQLVSAQ